MPVASEVRSIFESIAFRYDLANVVLSAGACVLWKRRLFKLIDGCNVQGADKIALDLCCGTGTLLPGLAKRFGTVKGVDFCEPMLALAERCLAKSGHKNVELICGDAMKLSMEADSVDVVTVAYGLRNLENLAAGLGEIRRVLRQGGIMVALEFGQPHGRIMGPLYRLYSKICLPLIGGILTGNRKAYRYLEETSSRFPCGKDFCEITGRHGFSELEACPLWGGIAYLYKARKS